MVGSIYDIIRKDKGTKESPALSDYLLVEEEVDKETRFLSTNVIPLNLLFSGRVDGGIPIGKISMISAPSMLGKSFIALGLIRNAQKKGMQCVIIDTEYSFDYDWAKSLGIDVSPNKLIVISENSIEHVKNIIMKICDGIPKAERKNVLFVIDSWGALVTSKTMEDALTGKDVLDMTEAKKKNQLSRILLNTRATYFVVNHVYDNTGGFGDPLKIPGGRGIVFLSSCVVLGISRAKESNKTTKEVLGHVITAETHKSRFSKERSKLEYRIKHDGGLDPFYGIVDDALEAKVIEVAKPGYYSRPCVKNDKAWKEDSIYCSDFWLSVFKTTNFKSYLEKRYTFDSSIDIVSQSTQIDEIESVVVGQGTVTDPVIENIKQELVKTNDKVSKKKKVQK
jgi:RecA/RadA recombinase